MVLKKYKKQKYKVVRRSNEESNLETHFQEPCKPPLLRFYSIDKYCYYFPVCKINKIT